MDSELLNKVTWKIPNALALVGSRAGDERNAMTTSWITQLSMEPVLIGVGVVRAAVVGVEDAVLGGGLRADAHHEETVAAGAADRGPEPLVGLVEHHHVLRRVRA